MSETFFDRRSTCPDRLKEVQRERKVRERHRQRVRGIKPFTGFFLWYHRACVWRVLLLMCVRVISLSMMSDVCVLVRLTEIHRHLRSINQYQSSRSRTGWCDEPCSRL